MASNNQQQGEGGSLLNVPGLFGMIPAIGYSERLMIAWPGTPGWRATSGPQAIFGLFSILLYTLFTASPLMAILTAVFVLLQLVNRVLPRDPAQHSKYIGDSMFFGSWTLGLLFYGGAGFLLFQEIDPPAGLWLMATSLFNLLALALLSRRDAMVSADQRDAVIDSINRSRSY